MIRIGIVGKKLLIYPPEYSPENNSGNIDAYSGLKKSSTLPKLYFAIYDKTIDNYDIIIKLRSIHQNISNKIYPPLSFN